MKILLVLHGAMASGKSTWVKEHGLSDYCLSPDDFRIKMAGASMDVYGNPCYAVNDQSAETAVWDELYKLLAYRMCRGEFCVLDACFTKNEDLQKIKKLAERYRYRVYCVDFSGVSKEECLKRNAARSGYKKVPEAAIEKAYARMSGQKITGMTVIKPDELDKALFKPLDLSNYRAVCHVGDLHGCFSVFSHNVLNQSKMFDDDIFYIFVGDYFDRGIENGEMAQFLYSVKDKKNVLLLTGNHERVLWLYAHPEYAEASFNLSSIQNKQTIPEFQKAGFTPEMASLLYQKLGQCAYYTFHGETVFVCHGGIPAIPQQGVSFIPTSMLIHGVGYYSEADIVASSWEKNEPNVWQVFGHRNETDLPLQPTPHTFDLTHDIEAGGYLRTAVLSMKDGYPVFEGHEYKNEVFDISAAHGTLGIRHPGSLPVSSLIKALRSSSAIQERDLGGGISSFNFTREAFHSASGFDDPLTSFARGLFLDTETNQYVARSYEKFFKINEKPQTQLQALSTKLAFPLTVYKKENGFLGLVSYDPRPLGNPKGNRPGWSHLFVASRTVGSGPFVNILWTLLTQRGMPLEDLSLREKFAQTLKKHNWTAIFECIDPVRDPVHIIKEKTARVVLLDLMNNETGKKEPYETLLLFSTEFGIQIKERTKPIVNFEELCKFHEQVTSLQYCYHGERIEGFVLEDANGFMLKEKTGYYNKWKGLRTCVGRMIKKLPVSMDPDEPIDKFFQWAIDHMNTISLDPNWNIIELRDKYLSEGGKE